MLPTKTPVPLPSLSSTNNRLRTLMLLPSLVRAVSAPSVTRVIFRPAASGPAPQPVSEIATTSEVAIMRVLRSRINYSLYLKKHKE